MGEYVRAEGLLLDTLPRVRASLGEDHPRYRDIATDLVTLYESWGKPGKAAEFERLLK